MPVILPQNLYDEWLEPVPMTAERLQEVLVPHPAEGMEAYPVSTYVNKPVNDGPQCIARFAST
jgi:putative SOS response-associated peptidase YedK